MMYGAFTFSKNGNMVSRPRDLRAVGFMGQRMGLSELDVQVLGHLYGCRGNVTATDPNAKLSIALREAAGSHAEVLTGSGGSHFTTEMVCQDATSSGYFDDQGHDMSCSALSHQCGHSSLGDGIRSACPRTCHECVPGMWPGMSGNCLLCDGTR